MFKFFISLISVSFIFADYTFIETIAEKFTREFTVFDIGAADGSFCYNLSEKIPLAKCIMVEDNNPKAFSLASKLLNKCIASKSTNLPLLLNKRLCNSDLKILSQCCYFDIVTVLGDKCYTSKHSSWGLENYVTFLLNLGWHTFIECKENSSIENILLSKNPIDIIPLENGNYLFYFEKVKTSLNKLHLFSSIYTQQIQTTFDKNITIVEGYPPSKYKILQRPAGISLINFSGLYGSFPTKDSLLKEKNHLKINTKQSMYPHEIYVTNNGFKLTASHLPLEDLKPLTNTLFTQLIKATTKAKIQSLLKDDTVP